MARRTRARREVLGVTPDLSKAYNLEALSGIAGTASDIMKGMQKKKDIARINDYMADSQIQMLEATNKWRVENEADPTDEKALNKLDFEYGKILGQYNNEISGLSRDDWFAASNKLKNQFKLQNATWGIRQEVVNAESNVNNSIQKNLTLAQGLGNAGSIDEGLAAYKTSRQALEAFASGIFSQQKTKEILDDYESDYMEAFIGGMLETQPDAALELLKREDVKESLGSKEREDALKELSDKRKDEMDLQFETDQVASELESTGFLSGLDTTLAEKLGHISQKESNGEISDEYAKLAKIYIKSKASVDPKTGTPQESELIRLSGDMKAMLGKDPNVSSSRAFLRRHKQLNELAMKYMGNGKVSTEAAKKIIAGLNTSLSQATSGAASKGTFFGYEEADADKFFKTNLKNQLYRNQALREFFYQTDGRDLSKQDKKTIAEQIVKKIEDDVLGEPIEEEKISIGTVDQGYRFKGGDRYDKSNWEKI